jgi:hypothetical protein
MVRIVQCLCPSRHCIMAIAYLPGITSTPDVSDEDITLTEANAADHLRLMVEDAVGAGWLDPWCGICRSRDFHYEDGRTAFQTLAEAYPVMKALEDAQRRTREFMKAAKN